METKLSTVLKKIRLSEKLYEVYSPQEEREEPEVGRSRFNSREIRNIMLFYFGDGGIDTISSLINNMPDEWVVEFLRHQGDTVVNPVSSSTAHSLCVHEIDEEHGYDDGW